MKHGRPGGRNPGAATVDPALEGKCHGGGSVRAVARHVARHPAKRASPGRDPFGNEAARAIDKADSDGQAAHAKVMSAKSLLQTPVANRNAELKSLDRQAELAELPGELEGLKKLRPGLPRDQSSSTAPPETSAADEGPPSGSARPQAADQAVEGVAA